MTTDHFDDKDFWKGIILFGLNAATYKMALANVLLDFAQEGKSTVEWYELSQAFLAHYQRRLSQHTMPQQGNPTRLTVMERVVKQLESGAIDFTAAVEMVGQKGLDNVIRRFQTIGTNNQIVKDRFYAYDFGKRLTLKDSLLVFSKDDHHELREEVTARWGLLEGAFSLTTGDFLLANDVRETYLQRGYNRTPLTNNIPFLSGYQGNACFYCGEALEDGVHVDHVLPRQVIQHDEIWNLVLAHDHCNLLKSDKLVGPHFIQKLIARNENIMGSNHPWKHRIAQALGQTKKARSVALQRHYDNVKTVLGNHWFGGDASYNPASDPFYRRLITVLNNTIK